MSESRPRATSRWRDRALGRRRTATATAAALAGLAATALAGCGFVQALPVDPHALGGLARTSVVTYADGSLITTLHAEQDRRPMRLKEIPQILVQAVLAAEDRRFYDHAGIDVRGILRAAAVDAEAGHVDEGGSTITQQLVKNTLVTPERSLHRKIREAALALGLERSLTKNQILERYLNTVYFGEGAYGVGAAVRVYFGHLPTHVSVAEAAMLAGLIRSPATADPIEHRQAAALRRATVLDEMVGTGAITQTQASTADKAALPRRAHHDDVRYDAPYAVTEAVQQLLADKRLGTTRRERESAIFRGGLHIRLTVDRSAQQAAETSLAQVLTSPSDPDGAIAAVEPGNGAITALVGGRNFWSKHDPTAKVDLAYGGTTKRQAGSTFKMFDLVTALESGISPEDRFDTGRHVDIPRTNGQPVWSVDNYEGEAFGKISVRQATAMSVNTAYARIVTAIGHGDPDAGAAAVVKTAEAMGVRGAHGSRLRVDPATTLGAQEVDPVSMAAAYATLADDGIYAKPYLVAEVKDAHGHVLIRNHPERTRVVSKATAAIATNVLQSVIADGTGVRARLPRPMAGKTGTAQGYHDAWFIGYTPNFAAAVWMGVAKGEVSMVPENGFRTVIAGGTFPAEVWRRFAEDALLGRPAPAFPTPPGSIVSVQVDKVRGCLPNQWTPPNQVTSKDFLVGTAPTKTCTLPIGPPPATMPALLGLTENAARAKLEKYGFVIRTVKGFDATYAPGTVTGQDPASDDALIPGQRITLTVAERRNVRSVVPNLLGLTLDEAGNQLAALGLVLDASVVPPCIGATGTCHAETDRDANRVWRQDVLAGTTLPAGSHVSVAVGPRR